MSGKERELPAEAKELMERFARAFAPGEPGGDAERVRLVAGDEAAMGVAPHARLHVALAFANGGPAALIGSVDLAARTSALHSHAEAVAQHAGQFAGAPLPLERAAYEALAERLRAFFAREGLPAPGAPRPAAALPAAAPTTAALAAPPGTTAPTVTPAAAPPDTTSGAHGERRVSVALVVTMLFVVYWVGRLVWCLARRLLHL